VTDTLYPEIQPHEQGMLDVGDGNRMHWAVYGNPSAKPAVVVHGGPGSGSSPGAARLFDPSRYRVHLIADVERLRVHLGADRWLLFGGSWGSTLILVTPSSTPAASRRSSSGKTPCSQVNRTG
jgi:proline iminopeptidase